MNTKCFHVHRWYMSYITEQFKVIQSADDKHIDMGTGNKTFLIK